MDDRTPPPPQRQRAELAGSKAQVAAMLPAARFALVGFRALARRKPGMVRVCALVLVVVAR